MADCGDLLTNQDLSNAKKDATTVSEFVESNNQTTTSKEGKVIRTLQGVNNDAQDAIDSFKLKSKGQYLPDPITLNDGFEYVVYLDKTYFAVSPPYTTDPVTYPTPDLDTVNLIEQSYLTRSFGEKIAGDGDSQLAGGNIWPLSSQQSAQVGDDLTGYEYIRIQGGDFSEITLFQLAKSDASGDLPSGTIDSINDSAIPYSVTVSGDVFYAFLPETKEVEVERFGGNFLGDSTEALQRAIEYAEAISQSSVELVKVKFNRIRFDGQVVINNYSRPVVLEGNLLSYQNPVDETAIIIGEEGSPNGIYPFELNDFLLRNDSGVTQSIGLRIFDSAYHKVFNVSVRGFDEGLWFSQCIGAIHDLNNREWRNTTTNIKATITAARKNNLYTLKNIKLKLDSAGLALDLDSIATSELTNIVADVLPAGSRPLRITNAFEQTNRNAVQIRQLWCENYGNEPVIIDNSRVHVENSFMVPNGAVSYAFEVTGANTIVTSDNVFGTSSVSDYLFFIDTATVPYDNYIQCSFRNSSAGISTPPSNLSFLHGYSRQTYSKRLITGGNANNYVLDLEAELIDADFRLKYGGESGSVTMKLMGRTGTSVDYAEYELALATPDYAGVTEFLVSNVRPTWSTVDNTFGTINHITVSYPVDPKKPIFTFAAGGNGSTGFANLTLLLEFNAPDNRYIRQAGE